MNKVLIIGNSIHILAPASRVWDVLTEPGATKKYRSGWEPVTDWKPGSLLLWKVISDGKEIVAVKGRVVEIVPGYYLAYTTIDANGSLKDIPENYLTITSRLEEQTPGQTTLTVTRGDFASVTDSAGRHQDVFNQEAGWNPIPLQIKQLAES